MRRHPVSSRAFPLLLGLPVCLAQAVAADYHVAPNGSDSNRGSQRSPFRTIAHAVSAAAPGDQILLQDGTYGSDGHLSDGTGGGHGYVAPVKISKAGKPNAWITLKAENQWGAVLDCGTTATSLGCDKNIILEKGAAYWSFENLVFTGGAFGGIGTDSGASNIRILKCKFENIGNWFDATPVGEDGIGFDAHAADWLIQGNIFHDIGRTGGQKLLQLDHGIYAAGSGAVITNNVFFNLNKGWAIQTANGASDWLIAHNTFAFPSASQGQIMLWGNNSNIRIQNNIFFNPKGEAVTRWDSHLRGCQMDHNLIYGASGTMESPGDCNIGSNLMGASPQFVNSTQPPYDFHLKAGSPANSLGAY